MVKWFSGVVSLALAWFRGGPRGYAALSAQLESAEERSYQRMKLICDLEYKLIEERGYGTQAQNEAAELQAQLDNAKSALGQAKLKLAGAEAELAAANSKVNRAEENLDAALVDNALLGKAFNAARADLKERREQSRQDAERFDTQVRLVRAYEQSIKAFEDEVATLRAQMDSDAEAYKRANIEVLALEVKVENRERDARAAETTVEELRKQVDAAEDECLRAGAEASELAKTVETLKARVGYETGRYDHLYATTNGSNTRLRDMEANLKRADKTIEILERASKGGRFDDNHYKMELDKLREEHAHLQKRVVVAETRAEDVAQRSRQDADWLRIMVNDTVNVAEPLAKLTEENVKLQLRLTKAQSRLKKARAELAKSRTQHAEQVTDINAWWQDVCDHRLVPAAGEEVPVTTSAMVPASAPAPETAPEPAAVPEPAPKLEPAPTSEHGVQSLTRDERRAWRRAEINSARLAGNFARAEALLDEDTVDL